ncbi:ATP-binding protein [Chloroflexota bacterium]
MDIPFDEELDFETKLRKILGEAVNTLGGNAGIIALWNERERRFVEGASYGLDPEAIDKLRPLLRSTIPELAVSSQSFDILSHLAPHLDIPATTTDNIQDPIIALPLEINEKISGLIYVLRPYSKDSFSNYDQNILSAFADQVAISVQNAQLLSRLAEERYTMESILESSADGILTISPKRTITSFNVGMERITGWKKEEVLGRYCWEVLRLKNSRHMGVCHISCPIIRGIEGYISFEGIINTRDEQEVDVGMGYSIACLPSGEFLPTVVNVRDISRLRQIEDLRSSILAKVTHELQTPISVIKAYAGTLARDDVRWSRQVIRDKLKAIEEESDRLSSLVGKLLYTSRIESEDLTLNKLPLDLSREASKVAKRFDVLTEIHKLQVDFPGKFPLVFADPEKIEEVLINLIENAIKYSPNGGTITIKGEILKDIVVVSISDEGIGIPLRDQEQIFDSFYRVEDSSTEQIKGTGLGLNICKTIIEAHGGKIWLESTIGKGSRFIFSLPREEK